MLSMHESHGADEAHQLGAEYGLGEYIREYRTNKRSAAKSSAWTFLFIYAFMAIIVLFSGHFRFDAIFIPLYEILTTIVILIALVAFTSLLLVYPEKIYIYSSGFIQHGRRDQAVRWIQVDHVLSGRDRCIVYVTAGEKVILGKYIERRSELIQQIELKASLVKHPEGPEDLEQQFEIAKNRQPGKERKKENLSAEKQDLIAHEKPEEAFHLQEEYQMGDFLATYHAGFSKKNILRSNLIGLQLLRALILAFAALVIGGFVNDILSFFDINFFPTNFIASNFQLLFYPLCLLSAIFMPRFFARHTRLHIYTEGFIYIEGGMFEVVRWEQVEKIVYHKTFPIFSPPLCHLYLTTNDKLAVSGYMHEKNAVESLFSEHINEVVYFDEKKPDDGKYVDIGHLAD